MQITLSVHIRSDSRPEQLLVAGHVKLDMVQELSKFTDNQVEECSNLRTYTLEKCPDRNSSIQLDIKLTSVRNTLESG